MGRWGEGRVSWVWLGLFFGGFFWEGGGKGLDGVWWILIAFGRVGGIGLLYVPKLFSSSSADGDDDVVFPRAFSSRTDSECLILQHYVSLSLVQAREIDYQGAISTSY